MTNWLDKLSDEQRQKLQQRSLPDWMDPMLATLTDRRFSDENWIYERKLDGERCLAYGRDGEVDLYSRNQESLNVQYPELVEALQDQSPADFILDGEVVAFDGDVTSFSKLQGRMHVSSEAQARQSSVKVYYYLFDLLYLEDYDLTQLPLRQRKSVLKSVFDFKDPLRYMIHRNESGEELFDEACRKGWEGIIAKQADAPYVHSRSKKWLKFKCVNQQELVIGGYTDPQGERIRFGALLLGYYQRDELHYAGKVGTGFDDETLKRLGDRLSDLEQDQPAYRAAADLPSKGVHWVKPELVAEIGFEEWTEDGKLRQPRYLGLRQDKDPHDVHRERPQS